MIIDVSNYSLLIMITYIISGYVISWVFLMLILYLSRVGYSSISKLDPDSDWMEFVWTGVPITAVSFMCLSNMACMIEDAEFEGSYYLRVVAHQWYWNYEDAEYGGHYDSIMNDFIGGVNKPLRVFSHCPVVLCMTSADVIHSFALPEFFFKVDIMPGRVSYNTLAPLNCGISIGYCSELCGAGHAYMPIVAEVIDGRRVIFGGEGDGA